MKINGRFIRHSAAATVAFAATILVSCTGSINLLELLDAEVADALGQSEYELTISVSGNGTVSPQGSMLVTESAVTEITATPDGGFNFLRWEQTGGAGSVAFGNVNDAATSVLLRDGDATIRAVFTADSYQLTVTDDGNGSTTPVGLLTVDHGVDTGISANEDTGYDFVNWTVISGSATIADTGAASTTVTLTSGDAAVQANFTLESYTLTVTNDGDGSAGPSTTTVQYNVPRNINASPNRFKSFDRWVQSGGSGTASFTDSLNRYTSVRVTGGDVTIQAQFKNTTYSLTKRGDIDLNVSGYLNTVYDIEVDGNNLYIGGTTNTNFGAIMKLDVTSKSNPTVVATRTTASGGRVSGIAITGTKIWAADALAGMYTLDRSTFATIHSNTTYSPQDVVPHPASTSFAFAADSTRIREYYDGTSSLTTGDNVNISEGIQHVQAEGSYGFATASDGDTGQFVSFDLGNLGDQGDLVVADSIPSITSGFGTVPRNFIIHESEIAYLASDDDGLITVYVDTPTDMSVADTLAMSNDPFDIDREYFTGDTYYKELLFTASTTGTGKYDFIDIATWTNPQVVDSFDTDTGTDPSCIVVDGNYLYAIEEGDRVVIYEIGID